MTYTWVLFLQVLLIGASLAMDAFAVSITDGLCYHNLSKVKSVAIPAVFGVFQAIMPIIGYFVAFGLSQAFKSVFEAIDHWVAFILLAIIGGKMLFDAIKEMRSPEEETHYKEFSFAEVAVQGVATSIDALFIGISFAATEGLKDSIPNMFLSVAIIGVVTFIISAIGVFFGVKLGKAFKKHASITEIIGGLVLFGIGLKILIEGLI